MSSKQADRRVNAENAEDVLRSPLSEEGEVVAGDPEQGRDGGDRALGRGEFHDKRIRTRHGPGDFWRRRYALATGVTENRHWADLELCDNY